MKFGWISVFGAVIVALLMVPNLIYARKKAAEKQNAQEKAKRAKSKDKSEAPDDMEYETAVPKWLSVCEQIGRYACILLMCVPLFVGKFGFSNPLGFSGYLLINAMLLIYYYIAWFVYSKGKTLKLAMTLAYIPTAIFFLSGMLLRHWALIAASVIFGITHCWITYLNHKEPARKSVEPSP